MPTDDLECSGNRDLVSFADMAWQVFRFVTWPAKTAPGSAWPVRGAPAPSLPAAGEIPVFLTYKADWETLREKGAPPQPWDKHEDTAFVCKPSPALRPGMLVLSSLHEFGNVTEPAFSGLTNVLVAQNDKVVHYMTSFGPEEFGLIMKGRLYDAAHDPKLGPGAPSPDALKMKNAIVVKSAWVEVNPALPASHSFYTVPALIRIFGSNDCELKMVGLVGLHIALKTPTSPQWIWSSFEHVDNVPENGAAGPRSFHDSTNDAMPSTPPIPDQIKPNTSPASFAPIPFNVTRQLPTAGEVDRANTTWQGIMKQAGPTSVWSNYKLVTVQWPGQPSNASATLVGAAPTPPCLSDPGTNMANMTMETFQQDGGACVKVTSTCMGCHFGARTSDFIYALPLKAQQPLRPFSETTNRISALEHLCHITGRCGPVLR